VTFKFWELLKNASEVTLVPRNNFFLKILNLVQSFVECKLRYINSPFRPNIYCLLYTSLWLFPKTLFLDTSSLLVIIPFHLPRSAMVVRRRVRTPAARQQGRKRRLPGDPQQLLPRRCPVARRRLSPHQAVHLRSAGSLCCPNITTAAAGTASPSQQLLPALVPAAPGVRPVQEQPASAPGAPASVLLRLSID
jgi:hypothetical protein